MKKINLSLMFLFVAIVATAQSNYDSILVQIEANSTSLNALREQKEAQKLGNRTGIFLSNPEVEFNYLWGSPSAIGNRTDFAVKQSFDFPTAYSRRNQISNLENANAELAYKAERINLLLQAKQICIELIYNNALANEYGYRLKNAEQIANAYKSKLEKGETNAIENNKAQLNLINIQNELARIEIEQATWLSQLKGLNGGKNIAFHFREYTAKTLPANFEDWYLQSEPKSPVLQFVNQQVRIAEAQIKLNRALSLPKFSAGYMSEKIVGEQFQGISVGFSLPLWENKNKTKQAQSQLSASQLALANSKIQFYNRLQSLYQKATNLRQSASKYRTALSTFGNETLLKKALEAGEISLLNYLMEIEHYYTTLDKALETERNFELTFAELSAVEM